jgi:hypothetical protein
MSSANTKKVHTKGITRVRYSQWKKMEAANATVEIRNNNQYKPVGLLVTAVIVQKSLRKNRAKALIKKGFSPNLASFSSFITRPPHSRISFDQRVRLLLRSTGNSYTKGQGLKIAGTAKENSCCKETSLVLQDGHIFDSYHQIFKPPEGC